MIEKTKFTALLVAAANSSLLTRSVPRAVLRTLTWIESKVELTPEDGPVIRVDKFKDTLVDDI